MKFYKILYVTHEGQQDSIEIGARDVRGAINNAFELRSNVFRVISAKQADQW